MENTSFKDLDQKVCVITGGTGEIGSAMARALSALGVKLALIYHKNEHAQASAQAIEKQSGHPVRAYQANVLDRAALLAAKEQINAELGKVDLLINAAGGNSPKATTAVEGCHQALNDLDDTFFGLDLAGFDFVFDLNFKGTLLPSMLFAKDMLEQGRGTILNVSSMNSYKPLTKIPAYSAAKAAVNNFTEWLAVHFAQTGIRVNAIAPGFFLTQQNRFLLVDEQTGEPTPRGQKILDNTPMRRYGELNELQGTTLYLLSDISRFVTGVCIPVDGGFSAFGGV